MLGGGVCAGCKVGLGVGTGLFGMKMTLSMYAAPPSGTDSKSLPLAPSNLRLNLVLVIGWPPELKV